MIPEFLRPPGWRAKLGKKPQAVHVPVRNGTGTEIAQGSVLRLDPTYITATGPIYIETTTVTGDPFTCGVAATPIPTSGNGYMCVYGQCECATDDENGDIAAGDIIVAGGVAGFAYKGRGEIPGRGLGYAIDAQAGGSTLATPSTHTTIFVDLGIGTGGTAGGDSADSAVLLGRGTSASPATSATADDKFVELRCQTTATTGGNRLMYLSYDISGTGTAFYGDCLRARSVVNANTQNVSGAHFGLEFKATAGGSECSGLGVACRGTLMIPDIASWAPTGSYYAGMFEIYSVGTASDPAGMTDLAVLRLDNSGDGTGGDDVDTDATIFSLNGWTSAADTTKVITSASLAELNTGGTVGIAIKIAGTKYYIPAVAATSWN